jgi:hypothetical protein
VPQIRPGRHEKKKLFQENAQFKIFNLLWMPFGTGLRKDIKALMSISDRFISLGLLKKLKYVIKFNQKEEMLSFLLLHTVLFKSRSHRKVVIKTMYL